MVYPFGGIRILYPKPNRPSLLRFYILSILYSVCIKLDISR
nr:MAG TPA: hypothetical protein [Caudoviricetes sp.]